jgi:hypothetical protein
METIFYIGIGNLINRKIIVSYSPRERNEKNKYSKESKDIIEKLLLISIMPNERYTESTNDDKRKILNLIDSSGKWVFMIIVIKDYPERYGYKLLNELQKKTLDTLNKEYLNKLGFDENLNNNFKNTKDDIQLYMVELERNYRDIGQIDKIRNIQNDVNDIKIEMKNNVNQMINNIELTSNLENRSDALRNEAKFFKKEAKKLYKYTWWKNKKITMTIGGVSLGTIVLLLSKYVFKLF